MHHLDSEATLVHSPDRHVRTPRFYFPRRPGGARGVQLRGERRRDGVVARVGVLRRPARRRAELHGPPFEIRICSTSLALSRLSQKQASQTKVNIDFSKLCKGIRVSVQLFWFLVGVWRGREPGRQRRRRAPGAGPAAEGHRPGVAPRGGGGAGRPASYARLHTGNFCQNWKGLF